MLVIHQIIITILFIETSIYYLEFCKSMSMMVWWNDWIFGRATSGRVWAFIYILHARFSMTGEGLKSSPCLVLPEHYLVPFARAIICSIQLCTMNSCFCVCVCMFNICVTVGKVVNNSKTFSKPMVIFDKCNFCKLLLLTFFLSDVNFLFMKI